jgi:hypothetical protein
MGLGGHQTMDGRRRSGLQDCTLGDAKSEENLLKMLEDVKIDVAIISS